MPDHEDVKLARVVLLKIDPNSDPLGRDEVNLLKIGDVFLNDMPSVSEQALSINAAVSRIVEEERKKDRQEIEILLWNLAGCNTYADGWADPIEGHEKSMERPALAAVRRLALRFKESQAQIENERVERTRLQAVINGFCAGLACKEPVDHDSAEVAAYESTGKEVEDAERKAFEGAAEVAEDHDCGNRAPDPCNCKDLIEKEIRALADRVRKGEEKI